MKVFEQITLGKQDWGIWGKNDDNVFLFSVKSVYTAPIAISEGDMRIKADFEHSAINEFLNTSFVRTLTHQGFPVDKLRERIRLFTAEEYRKITSCGYEFPPIKEEHWWLSTGSSYASNYMSLVNEDGDIVSECAAYEAGTRAVVVLPRSVLNVAQRDTVQKAGVPYNYCTVKETSGQLTTLLNDGFKTAYLTGTKEADKATFGTRLFLMRYHIVLCPKEDMSLNIALFAEVKDNIVNKRTLLPIEGTEIEEITLRSKFIMLTVTAYPETAPSAIIEELRKNLTPISVMETMTLTDRLRKRIPDFWHKGALISTLPLGMNTVMKYVETCLTQEQKGEIT